MKKFLRFSLFIAGVLFISACSSLGALESDTITDSDESIRLTINEAVEYTFHKIEGNWKGERIHYSLSTEDEKVISETDTAVNDSSLQDFDLMIKFLDLHQIQPQNEIKGWIPDPTSLPKRVYNFELFDGRSTKSFSYQDPIKYVRDHWQAQNVLMFVTYVQDEINWSK